MMCSTYRSPAQFLEEVLLVDDKSELEHLHEQLENEIEKPYYKGRVRLIRNAEREGLIRSRNNGAVAARGEVVIFLDAHCEVGYNWLPPLLAPIHADRWVLNKLSNKYVFNLRVDGEVPQVPEDLIH